MKSLRPPTPRQEVPRSVRVQISRLFGSKSIWAKQASFTEAQWKQHLRRVLKELESYLRQNVDTDELHLYMIYTGFLAAEEALKQDVFWAAYTEAILRITFLLLGDYPDHRRRKGGRKREGYYELQLLRSIRYTQDSNQKLRTLLTVPRFGLPKLDKDPNDALGEFRREIGFKATYKDFFKWYREKYGKDYSLVF